MEEWRDIYFIENGKIYDYRGLYQVSNIGRVKSLGNGNNTNAKEKILKAGKNKYGYEFVVLCKEGKVKQFYVHRLVLHMFDQEGYFNRAEVDHINTIKTDNRAINLRWCTKKDNCNNPLSKKHHSETQKGKRHSEETKRKISEKMKGKLVGENNPMYGRTGKNNPKSKKVIGISLTEKKVIILQSATEAEKFGFCKSHICACCNGKRKQHKGYKWFYLDDVKNNK